MPVSDYLPRSDAQRVIWYTNFAARFAAFAPGLGFTDDDIERVNDDLAYLNYVITRNEAIKSFAKDVTSYKKIALDATLGKPSPTIPAVPVVNPPAVIPAPGVYARLRVLVGRIKTSATYSTNVGRDLGVIAADDPAPNPNLAEPNLTVALTGGTVQIKFVKGIYNGILLQSMRGNESDWQMLQVVAFSPFYDQRPKIAPGLPEIRKYRAQYMQKDKPVGQWSAVENVLLP